MRMWMIDPKLMCNQHLLGEHVEIHKHRHNFVKKHNMAGRLVAPAQIEPYSMGARHAEIAAEMTARGMNHKSQYDQPDVSYLPDVKVDLEYNMLDLAARCPKCNKIIHTRNKRNRDQYRREI